MKIATSIACMKSLPLSTVNGLNHETATGEPGTVPEYTFVSATTAKIVRMTISAASSNFCVMAESSMPQ